MMRWTKQLYPCLLFFILFSNAPLHSHAQKFTFAIPGSTWLYQNKGRDTSVGFIRISRDGSEKINTWHGGDSFSSVNVIRMRKELLAADSTVKGTTHFYLDTFNIYVDYIQMYDSFGTEQQLYSMDFLHFFKPYDPQQRQYGAGYFYKQSNDTITVNGHRLRIGYKFPPSSSDSCYNFCGPMLERVGHLGYFFPVYMCSMDTFYAGPLLWYSDPEIGRWEVPDSLQTSCDFHYPSVVKRNLPKHNEVSIYPNPANEYITASNLPQDGAALEVISVDGKSIYRQSINLSTVTIPVSGFPRGVYLLKISTSNGVEIQKWIKQ